MSLKLFTRIFVILIIEVFTLNSIVPSLQTSALTKDQKEIFNKNINYYNYDACSSVDSSKSEANSDSSDTTGSLGGVAGTGFTEKEVRRAKSFAKKNLEVQEGNYTGTAYGPPWNAMEGTGITSTGIPLKGPRYVVASDPDKRLPYGSFVKIQPNPFNWNGPFLVADTGGAFHGSEAKVDFYDWKGRAHQNAWGERKVKVTKADVNIGDLDEEAATSADGGECKCQASGGSVGGDVDKFLKVLAHQESGGNAKQPGSAGGARGKYQYIDSTWKSSATTYYKPALKYSQAHLAPEEMQDAVAFLEYSKKFEDLDSNLFRLAVSHFYPAANANPDLLDIVPPANVITPRQYANKLISTIKRDGGWQKIPLKYTSAPEFNKYSKNISISDSSVADSSGKTVSSSLCGSEGDADNEGVEGVSWPVSKKYWNQNREWFTKPHHDYPASDIPVSSGTKVYSMTEGTVLSAGASGGCGTGVFIQSAGGTIFGYCHGTPGSTKVHAGSKVRSGQLIMLSDNTGSSTGAHLHVQIKVKGQLRCPQEAFKNLAANKAVNFDKLPSGGCSY